MVRHSLVRASRQVSPWNFSCQLSVIEVPGVTQFGIWRVNLAAWRPTVFFWAYLQFAIKLVQVKPVSLNLFSCDGLHRKHGLHGFNVHDSLRHYLPFGISSSQSCCWSMNSCGYLKALDNHITELWYQITDFHQNILMETNGDLAWTGGCLLSCKSLVE